jgi:hypothetical protein
VLAPPRQMLGEEKYPRGITFDAVASDGRHFGDDAASTKCPIGAVGLGSKRPRSSGRIRSPACDDALGCPRLILQPLGKGGGVLALVNVGFPRSGGIVPSTYVLTDEGNSS